MPDIREAVWIAASALWLAVSPTLVLAQVPLGCPEPVAFVISTEGIVEIKDAPAEGWRKAVLNESVCPGAALHVGSRSRGAVRLPKIETILRVDQNTTVLFPTPPEPEFSILELIKGAIYFLSRRPRSLEVRTPFVNAGVEGTEFFMRVEEERERAFIAVFEGTVAATSGPAVLEDPSRLKLTSGQSAVGLAGAAPRLLDPDTPDDLALWEFLVRPRDAVQWTLYYPPVIFGLADRSDLNPALRDALVALRRGDSAAAFDRLDLIPEVERDASFYVVRAGALLAGGRVEEARPNLERAIALDPKNGDAYALSSVIAVTQNRTGEALNLAQRAVAQSPRSSAAKIALSYAQQASFDLEAARETLLQAVEENPNDGLAWARLAEVWLSLGYLGRALRAAERAAEAAPDLGLTNVILGFAKLARFEFSDARTAFEKAIALDSANPMARLGLGLAKIRRSDLAGGREDIEIAVALAPNRSILRSYLGKAYFEEKRPPLDAEQFAVAKELDPNDPTPFLYDAIRKQTENRPVEALRDIQKSIELNDNRAVYRSRLLLDKDLAARQASLARIYDNLGFEQLGVLEATNSLSVDPANFSAHRFLSDTYARLPRHEIARASELLQAQLLQPISINPIQPSLQVFDLNVVQGASLTAIGLNEFSSMFERDRAQLAATGFVGNNDTIGNEVVGSIVSNKLSLAVGQFHSETDGFRDNNDVENNLHNLFGQLAVTPDVSLQAEFRRRKTDQGDLTLNFDPDDFLTGLRRDIRQDTFRVGGRHKHRSLGTSIFSALYTDFTDDTKIPEFFDFRLDNDQDGYQVEGRHIFSEGRFMLTAGGGWYSLDQELIGSTFFGSIPGPTQIEHANGYVYAGVRYPETLEWIFGLSYDDYEEQPFDQEQLNPKFGISWQINPRLKLRLAAVRTLARARSVNRTIEPTEVAGFNQFFDDFSGTDARQYSAALDAKITSDLFVGIQYTQRDLEGPIFALGQSGTEVDEPDQDEQVGKAYAYWTPSRRWALRAGVEYERFEQKPDANSIALEQEVETWLAPIAAAYFDPIGVFAELRSTYVRQDVDFEGRPQEDDSFLVVDAVVGYRFPKRYGVLSLEVSNLLDDNFNYQDVNFRTSETINPRFIPDRTILARLTLKF